MLEGGQPGFGEECEETPEEGGREAAPEQGCGGEDRTR